MDKIQITARFTGLTEDNLDAFKQLVTDAVVVTRDEPATLGYDWFLNEDSTVCILREIYENSDALLLHLGNVGELLAGIFGLGLGMEVDVFGNPSPELLEAGAPFNPTVYPWLNGK